MTDHTCPVCSDQFTTATGVRDHAWDVHGVCHYCGDQFENRTALYTHWLDRHEGEPTDEDWKRATKKVGDRTVCPVCDRRFDSAQSVQAHAWDAHGACHHCGDHLDTEDALYVHWLAVHEDDLAQEHRRQANDAVGSLTIGDRLAHQGPFQALTETRPRRRTLLYGAGLAVAGGGAAVTLTGSGGSQSPDDDGTSASTGLGVGERPPDFALQTIADSQVSLHPVETPTVVFFMASWCAPCRLEEQNLTEMAAKYSDAIRLITVDVDPQQDSLADLQQFQSEYGGDWPHAMATEEMVQTYRIDSLDTTYILNANGVTAFKDERVTKAETLDRELSALVEE